MRRETCFSRSAILPRLQIEIARDTPSSIAHAAPSDVSLPAVSFGALRMPAPVCVASPSCGRHPKPAQIRKSLLSLDHVVKRITEPRPTPVFRLTAVSSRHRRLAVWPIATYPEPPSEEWEF